MPHSLRWLPLSSLALAGILLAVGGACTSSSFSPCSNATTMYQVFQPNASTSMIPVCPDDGIPPTDQLSSAAQTECGTLCAQNFSAATTCCISQWEPQTVLCPACVP